MNEQPELLGSGCVIEFNPDHFITQLESHQVFSFDEICELLHSNISEDIDKEEENWTYTGLQCSVMVPGTNWRTGTLRLRLEFIPDEVKVENSTHETETGINLSEASPLDDIRQSLLNQSED